MNEDGELGAPATNYICPGGIRLAGQGFLQLLLGKGLSKFNEICSPSLVDSIWSKFKGRIDVILATVALPEPIVEVIRVGSIIQDAVWVILFFQVLNDALLQGGVNLTVPGIRAQIS